MKRLVKNGLIMTCIILMGMLLPQTVHAQTVKQIPVSFSSGESVGKTLQAALDEALEDQSGETLYEIQLPSGTYKLDTLLKVYSYTTIKMNGCKLVRSTGKTMLRIGLEDEVFSGHNGYHDITIEGGTFDGNGKSGKVSASMIRMGHGKNLTFRNMTFQNVYDTHHVELAACANVLFEGCKFKDFYGKGNTVNSGNNEALQFDIIHNKTHFPKYPGFDDTPCKDVTVQNCTFQNLQRGVGTHSAVAGSYFTNMTFTNNKFSNVKGYAIIATNYRDSDISQNTISRCGAGILFRSMVQGYNNFYTPLDNNVAIEQDANSTIAGNRIEVSDYRYKTTSYGISLYGAKLSSKKKNAPKGDYTLKGVTVSGNRITMNNSGYGVWLQGTDSCTVASNTITMNVKASASGKGNSDCMRLVKSSNIQITGNTMTQKKKNKKTKNACGIVVTTKSSATINKNKINASPKDGVFVVTGSKATMDRNTIKKTGRYGVNVCDKSNVVLKKSNKLSKCGKRKTNTYSGGKIKKK